MTTLRVVLAFAAKDFRLARSYRFAFVASVGTVFWTLVTFRFISELVRPGFTGTSANYFGFVVVGIALASVMQSSATAASGAARQDQLQGTLEILVTQPVSKAALGLGWCAYPTLQALVTGVLTLLLSVPLGFRLPDPDFSTAAVVLLFSALVFTSMGLLGAAVVLALQQGGQVINLVLAAMGFLGGALFPVEVLPGWLQTISRLSPLTYALQALRGAVLDGRDVIALRGDLLVLLAFATVLLPLSVLALTQSFNYAQARGTLGRY